MIQYSRDASAEPGSYGVLDTPPEPVIGLAEGETRWRGMTGRLVTTNDTTKLSAKPQMPLKRSIPEFPTKVGGHHMTKSTDLARDSSLKDR